MKNNKKKERETRFDILRITSMFLVIVIHVANCYCRNIHNISKISFLIAEVFNILARVSVPVFFMISGALLGKSKFDFKKYIKRISRFIIVIILWDLIYYLWETKVMGITYGKSFTYLLHDPFRKHLWFLYTITYIYIFQPLVSLILNKVKWKGHIILTLLWIGACMLLTLKLGHVAKYILKQTCYVGYFILGSIIYEYTKERKWKKFNIIFITLFAISNVINIIMSYTTSIAHNINYKAYMAYTCPLIMISSISIFILVMNNYNRPNNKFILKTAEVSFGIYLVHGIFLDITKTLFNYNNIPSIIGIPLFAITIFILSFFVVLILKKIPILNKYTT